MSASAICPSSLAVDRIGLEKNGREGKSATAAAAAAAAAAAVVAAVTKEEEERAARARGQRRNKVSLELCR